MKFILLLVSFLTLLSCGNDDFRKVEALNSFRVLGIYTADPEVSAAGPVNVQVIVSDVNGGGRTITGTWESCIDPGVALGAEVKCDHDPARDSGAYSVNTGTLLEMNTGLGPAQAINVPAGILTGRSFRDRLNGVGYLVIFRFEVDGQVVEAFRRINVVDTALRALNTEPTGSALFLNGGAFTNPPEKNARVSITTSAPESYLYRTAGGETETRSENYQVAWYVTQGEFDKPKSDIGDTVKFQGNTPTRPFLLLAIVRDERGGLDYVSQYFP